MRKLSAVLIIAVCMILSGCSFIFGRKKVDPDSYDNVIDIWQNNHVTEKQATDQAFKKLFAAAESGDQVLFAKNFAEEIRNSSGFDNSLKDFFASYPKGISNCELTYKGGGAGGSNDKGGGASRGLAALYQCYLDEKPYWITIKLCFQDTKHPEKVGISHFSIMNLEGRASYLVENNEHLTADSKYDFESVHPLVNCIKSDKEITAKLINGSPILWTPSDAPTLTEEEFRALLAENGENDISRLFDKIGKPGFNTHYFNHTADTCYYELAPKNGEPRYAYITTQTQYGKIYDAYVCTPDSCDFDNPLYQQNR